jgi:formylglycine-generating enzyme required for sulfatase activity
MTSTVFADDVPPPANAPFNAEQARELQRQWAAHLAEDVTVTNSLGMRMVLVPAGEFRQGASRRELEAIAREIEQDASVVGGMKKWSIDHIVPNEGPDHAVRISRPYRIAAHELTLGQFRKFVEATGYQTDAEREEIDPASDRVRRTWKDEPDFKNQQEDEPALNVSWNDAMALCYWLGKQEGRRYRLPTEAEWEFAARAGSAGRWCFGDDRGRLGEYAWYEGNSGGRPHAVGTKKPNAFGLFDMHGNMFEYAADFFADTDFEQRFGPKQPIAVDPTGILWGTRTCLRGGSFDTNSYFQRATSRLGGATRYQYIYHMGCRLVMVLGDDGPSEPVNISLAGRRARNAHAAAQPPERLVKHESNPVLEIASDGGERQKAFSITRMDDAWYLWHAAQPTGIERVVSADGIHWTRPSDKPVRGLGALFTSGLPLHWDDREIAMPYALKVTDHVLQRDVLMMYYAGAGNDGGSGLGYASFLIGAEARWNKHGFSPLLRGPVLDPCVVQVGETFALWCVQPIDGRTRICRAASPDGARWTPIDPHPVLPLGKDGEFDSHSHSMPRVLQMGRSLQLWYLGSNGQTTRLGLATSTDGTHWTKSAANPILDVGDKAAWDSGSILAHDVQWHDGRFHVWYAAAKGNRTATSTIHIGYALSVSTTTE